MSQSYHNGLRTLFIDSESWSHEEDAKSFMVSGLIIPHKQLIGGTVTSADWETDDFGLRGKLKEKLLVSTVPFTLR